MNGIFTVEEPFTCEVRVRRLSFTSTQGAGVMIDLPDVATMDMLQGCEGKRYQIALITIGDDENLAHSPAKPVGELCTEAIGLCNSEDFHRYIADIGPWKPTAEAAKGFILSCCAINSRKELDGSPQAASLFRTMRSAYAQWLARHP